MRGRRGPDQHRDEPTDFTVLGTENLLERPDLWDALETETGIVVLDLPGSL